MTRIAWVRDLAIAALATIVVTVALVLRAHLKTFLDAYNFAKGLKLTFPR